MAVENTLATANPALKQFSKFVVIGVLNTGIDFLILNILMFLTGIDSGSYMLLLNAISFGAATINSYFLNKRWTFEDRTNTEEGKKFSQFVGVSVVGMAINSLVVFMITTLFPPFLDILFVQNLLHGILGQSANIGVLWANFAKVVATGISLIWNFAGYKFFVFKK